jgi:hypothetical protein
MKLNMYLWIASSVAEHYWTYNVVLPLPRDSLPAFDSMVAKGIQPEVALHDPYLISWGPQTPVLKRKLGN